jgi:hypothetical protein
MIEHMFEKEEGSSEVSYLARLDPKWQRLESERILEEYAEEERIEQAYIRQQSAVNVSQFEMAELAALVDEKELWKSWGHQSLEHWISWSSGVAKGVAGKRARVARALKQFPKARKAFSKGKLSLDKMATLVRIADQDSEEDLLYLALQATASQFSLIARSYWGVIRREEELAEEEQTRARRFLDYYWDEDGALVIRGRLPSEEGAAFMGALDAAKTDLPEDEAAEDPVGAQRADALVAMATASLSPADPERSSPPRPHLVVTVDINALGGGDGRIQLDGGPSLPAIDAEFLACDCTLLGIVESDGQILNVGRKTRKIPLRLRRALLARDETCKYPGCTSRRFVDGHHLVHWIYGGETKLENLALLCPFHHRMLHREKIKMRRLGNGRFVFIRPDGRVIPNAPDPPESDAGAAARLEEEGTEFNPLACHEDQDGGRLNLHDVIASLFSSVEAAKEKRRAS